MRAVWISEFGPPEVLACGEAAGPVPGRGQVLIGAEIESRATVGKTLLVP